MKEKLKELMIESINSIQENDIYAFSIFLQDMDDDPLQPVIVFGYNTERQFEGSLNETDELEARWNFAFWLQNSEFVFGENDTAWVVEQWMKLHNFIGLTDDEIDEVVTPTFVKEIIEVVRDIHDEGIIKDKFGRELPILIHELEYYDEIAKQNQEANGQYLPEGFVEFCMG